MPVLGGGTYTDLTVASGVTYCYAVTALVTSGGHGNESAQGAGLTMVVPTAYEVTALMGNYIHGYI